MAALTGNGIKPVKRISWLTGIVLIIMGCTIVEQFIQKPSATYDKMELTNVSFDQATLLFYFQIHNPNPIGTSIDRVSYQLDLNGKKFIKGDLKQGITLAASGAVPLSFPVTIRYFDFFESIRDFVVSDHIQYVLSGSMRIGPFDVPYRTSGNVPVPRLPEISLKRIRIDQISLSGATLCFTIGLKNENTFALQPQALHYDIAMADISFASGKATKIKSVQSVQESLIELPVTIDFINLGRSAYHVLSGSSSDYRLSGDLEMNIPGIGIKKIPFEKQGDVSLKH